MNNHLRNLTLSTLAFALAPLAQANAATVFDSATTAWTGESSLSTTADGGSTFNLPAFGNGQGGVTGNAQGADYFTLPSAITTGSGVWTFNTTASFNAPAVATGINSVEIGVGFGNYVTTSAVVNSSGVASANGTGGPWIKDVRTLPNASGVSWFASLNGGFGSTGSATFASSLASRPEFNNQTAPVQLELVLDTTKPNWTVSEYVDGVLNQSFAYTTNPSITGIGIGAFEQNFDPTLVTFFDTTLTDTTVTAAVPEASTWAMMVLGFAGLGFLAHRRKDRNGWMNFRLA